MSTIPRGTLVFDHDTNWVWVAPDGTVLTPPAGSPTPVTHASGTIRVTDIAGIFGTALGTLGPTNYHEIGYSAQLAANFDTNRGNTTGSIAVALGVEGSVFSVVNGSTFTDPSNTHIKRLNATTGAVITDWPFAWAGSGDTTWGFAVAPDGLTAYGARGTAGMRYLYKFLLDGSGTQSLFKDCGSSSSSVGYPGFGNESAMVVLRNGILLIAFIDPADSVQYVVGYNSSGTEVYRFTIGASADYYVQSISEALDTTSFYILVYNSASSQIEFSNIRLSDGAVLSSWTKPDSVSYGSFAVVRTAIGAVLQPIPIPTPLAPQAPCDPQAEVSNGGKGQSGCSVSGLGFVSMYDTASGVGTVPSHPDPTEGEDLTDKKEIDIWVEWDYKDYLTGVITTYKRSFVELSPPVVNNRITDGVVAVGDFEYALAQEAGTADIRYSDAVTEPIDRLFHTKLAQQHLNWTEVRICGASPTRRTAGLSPYIFYRGIVNKAFLEEPLEVNLQTTDAMFGPLTKVWPPLIPKEIFPNAPPDTLALACPVLYGEKSDEGATDPKTGRVSSKGVLPYIYAGKYTIPGGPTPGVYEQDLAIPAPTVMSSTNLLSGADAPGFKSTTYIFTAALRVSDGKIGNITATVLDPAGVTEPNGIAVHTHVKFLNPTVPDPAYMYIDWVSTDPTYHPLTNPNVGVRGKTIHDGVTNDFYYRGVPGADSGADFSMVVVPEVESAPDEWGVMIALLGESYRVVPYGSNLAGGDSTQKPDRVKLTNLASRSDILTPWLEDGTANPNWTFPNKFLTWYDSTGKRWDFTVALVKGPLLDDALAGRCTMAFNALGRLGDNGKPIVTMGPARQRWYDDDVLSSFTGGAYVNNTTAPKWNDNTTYKVRSSSFAAFQAYTVKVLGGVGLPVSWYAGGYKGQKTVLEHEKDLNEGTEAERGTNNQGQFLLGYIDETIGTASWSKITHVTDIYGKVTSEHVVNLENRVRAVYDEDLDADKFRAPYVEKVSDLGILMNGGNIAELQEPLKNVVLSTKKDVEWVLSKRLTRLQFGEIPVNFTGPIWHMSLSFDGPGGILLTTIQGRGASGYVDTPCRLRRKRLSIGTRLCDLTVLDGTGLFGKTVALFTMSGIGTASFVGSYSGWRWNASGVGTASFVGRSIFSGSLSAAGVSSVSFVGTTV